MAPRTNNRGGVRPRPGAKGVAKTYGARYAPNGAGADKGRSRAARKKAEPNAGRVKGVGHYILGKTIGEGTFGKVRIGTHILTREKVAVKILEKSRIVEVADMQRVTREIRILKRNNHSNVIRLYEVLDTPSAIFMIMENADGGEMFDYIVAHQKVEEDQAARFFHQIIDGVEYLHKMEVTHRDLKPENLLLQSSANGWIIKIVDFGLSNTHDGGRLLQTACGSPCYAAPEMIAGKKYVGPKADVWSLGVILFALVCGYLPFEDANTSHLYKKILAGDYEAPRWISTDVRDLLRKVLTTEPSKRYTVDQIRQHPWMRRVDASVSSGATGVASSTGPEGKTERAAVDATAGDSAVDAEIVEESCALGINREALLEGLVANSHNNATTTYYLLRGRKKRDAEREKLSRRVRENLQQSSSQPAKPNVGAPGAQAAAQAPPATAPAAAPPGSAPSITTAPPAGEPAAKAGNAPPGQQARGGGGAAQQAGGNASKSPPSAAPAAPAAAAAPGTAATSEGAAAGAVAAAAEAAAAAVEAELAAQGRVAVPRLRIPPSQGQGAAATYVSKTARAYRVQRPPGGSTATQSARPGSGTNARRPYTGQRQAGAPGGSGANWRPQPPGARRGSKPGGGRPDGAPSRPGTRGGKTRARGPAAARRAVASQRPY